MLHRRPIISAVSKSVLFSTQGIVTALDSDGLSCCSLLDLLILQLILGDFIAFHSVMGANFDLSHRRRTKDPGIGGSVQVKKAIQKVDRSVQ